ncbi:MAG: hypothetical protein IPH98_17415 [Saprospiraceae bacterium]|nr:hypothetical protein [Candidatus Defluviibacterium haderslevense]
MKIFGLKRISFCGCYLYQFAYLMVFLLFNLFSVEVFSQCKFRPCADEDCGKLNAGFKPVGGPASVKETQ